MVEDGVIEWKIKSVGNVYLGNVVVWVDVCIDVG